MTYIPAEIATLERVLSHAHTVSIPRSTVNDTRTLLKGPGVLISWGTARAGNGAASHTLYDGLDASGQVIYTANAANLQQSRSVFVGLWNGLFIQRVTVGAVTTQALNITYAPLKSTAEIVKLGLARVTDIGPSGTARSVLVKKGAGILTRFWRLPTNSQLDIWDAVTEGGGPLLLSDGPTGQSAPQFRVLRFRNGLYVRTSGATPCRVQLTYV